MLCSFRALNADRAIVVVDWYGSGEYGRGVLWAAIEDSEGARAHICIDNRVDSETRGRIFDGARHPAKPGATLVEIGAEMEGDVVAMLSSWCDCPNNWHSQGGQLLDHFKEIFIETVLNVGAHS